MTFYIHFEFINPQLLRCVCRVLYTHTHQENQLSYYMVMVHEYVHCGLANKQKQKQLNRYCENIFAF